MTTDTIETQQPITAACDMTRDCRQPITHIDRSGYVYCTHHGLRRRMDQPCRKLTARELATIRNGQPVTRY
jgi:hypothetical protein